MTTFTDAEVAVIREAVAAPTTREGLAILNATFDDWRIIPAVTEADRLRAAQRATEAADDATLDPARRYAVWSVIRRVAAGQRVQLADGSLLTREALAHLLDQADTRPTGRPVRAVEQAGR